jgi:PHD/YefM family antitoxin component YafN of YafNO toxin-antitoxin module
MRTIELNSESPSLPDLLKIAHEEPVLIRTTSGEEFVLGAVDDFEREVELLHASPALRELLAERRKEQGATTLDELRASLRRA